MITKNMITAARFSRLPSIGSGVAGILSAEYELAQKPAAKAIAAMYQSKVDTAGAEVGLINAQTPEDIDNVMDYALKTGTFFDMDPRARKELYDRWVDGGSGACQADWRRGRRQRAVS